VATTLLRTPTARTFSISDLVDEVRHGRVRIPKFQRNYRWDVDDVLNLFDSIYWGYPIGSLLLWSSDAPHEVLNLGSLRVDAEATTDALWVVDGQQRITSLAGVLLSVGEVEDPRFSLYFDLENKKFVRGKRPLPGHWLPMNRVADTSALLRWLGELQRSGGADELVMTAERLSKRVREYMVPAYIVETDDEAALRTIFDRLNTFGKSLKSADVFHALHGGRRGQAPEDLRTLAAQVAELGFGSFNDNSLLRAVLALRGPDVYRDFRDEFGDDEDPTDTFRQAAAAIEQMIGFLRGEAEIVHLRVLPYRYVIPILARFFHLHPEPSSRSLSLLRRWVWRDALASARKSTSVSSMREAVRAVGPNEHESVQRLVSLASSIAPTEPDNLSARLNEARARANVARMGSWGPRSLADGQRLDLADHFDTAQTPLPIITTEGEWKASLANRMIHPPTTSSLQSLLLDSHLRHSDPVSFGEVLETHAVPLVSLSALESGDVGRFLEMRHDYLRKRLADTANRLAEWGSTDRPPLNALIVPDGDRDD
jgi:hypothetical protein